MIGVTGWKVYQMVTLIGSLPTASTIGLQPGLVGVEPGPPRGPLGYPLPAALGSVMNTHPVLAGGTVGDPTGLPPLGSGPFGQAGKLARFMTTACPWTAFETSVSLG